MALRRLIIPVLIGVLCGVPSPVAAQVAQNVCVTIKKKLSCRVEVLGGGTGNASKNLGATTTGSAIFRWERRNYGPGTYAGDIGACPGPDSEDPANGAGLWIVAKLYLISTGELLKETPTCVYGGDELPPPPPEPPTPGKVAEGLETIGRVPPQMMPSAGLGVVQFESWVWCDDPGPVELTVEVGPWRAHASMTIDSIDWTAASTNTTKPESFTATSKDCGAGTPNPASENTAGIPFLWTGHYKGDYDVTSDATWSGDAEFYFEGELLATVDMGDHVISETVPTSLNEIEVVNG